MTVNIGQMVATTLRNRQDELADNMTNHNALLRHMVDKGNGMKAADGGRVISQPLMYGDNSNTKWYNGMETWNIQHDNFIDAAEYDWKFYGGFAPISGEEEVKNSGKHAVIDLAKSKVENLKKTMRNTVAVVIHSDGTGSAGKEMGGLALLVQIDPTAAGTVGGINQQTHAFWRNQAQDLSGGATATTKENIQGIMNRFWLKCIRGNDKPDILLAGENMYTTYEESLQQDQRFVNKDKADAGFTHLMYKNAPVMYDDQAPAGDMLYLNTDYLHLRYHKDRKFKVGDRRTVTNADYDVIPVLFAGNMTCSNRSMQGRLRGKFV